MNETRRLNAADGTAAAHVYLLWHMPDGNDEGAMLLGLYSTEERAKDRIKRSRALPGFVSYPNDFVIDRYEVDRDWWSEGFITV